MHGCKGPYAYSFDLKNYIKEVPLMPPKGWRKNQQGKFPQNPKDTELVSIDEILFPKSTIAKLAKQITSGENDANMILSKDSLVALQRAATVFVSHLLFHARNLAKDADRKNFNAQDVLHALEKAEFMGFVPEVKQKLATFERNSEAKKLKKADTKAQVPISLDEGPAAKKLKDNTLKSVDSTVDPGDETAQDEEEDDDADTRTLEDEDEDDEVDAPEEDSEHRDTKTILNKDADLTVDDTEGADGSDTEGQIA